MTQELRDSTIPPLEAPPRLRSDPQRRKLHRARRAVATIPPTRVRGVLIVEDDPDLQATLARILTVRGNRVVGTSSAEGALELLRQWPVDLVLVDDGLPGMSGLELARTIRDRHPDTPVVLMTSRESAHARAAARNAGAVAVMAKPFRPDELVELLRSFPKAEAERGEDGLVDGIEDAPEDDTVDDIDAPETDPMETAAE